MMGNLKVGIYLRTVVVEFIYLKAGMTDEGKLLLIIGIFCCWTVWVWDKLIWITGGNNWLLIGLFLMTNNFTFPSGITSVT